MGPLLSCQDPGGPGAPLGHPEKDFIKTNKFYFVLIYYLSVVVNLEKFLKRKQSKYCTKLSSHYKYQCFKFTIISEIILFIRPV